MTVENLDTFVEKPSAKITLTKLKIDDGCFWTTRTAWVNYDLDIEVCRRGLEIYFELPDDVKKIDLEVYGTPQPESLPIRVMFHMSCVELTHLDGTKGVVELCRKTHLYLKYLCDRFGVEKLFLVVKV